MDDCLGVVINVEDLGVRHCASTMALAGGDVYPYMHRFLSPAADLKSKH